MIFLENKNLIINADRIAYIEWSIKYTDFPPFVDITDLTAMNLYRQGKLENPELKAKVYMAISINEANILELEGKDAEKLLNYCENKKE